MVGKAKYQSACVVNFPGNETAFTRIIEIKHATDRSGGNNPNTQIVREYPSATGEPYYPIGTEETIKVLKRYQELMKRLPWSARHRVLLAGRLGDYRYYNMDDSVRRGFEVFEQLTDMHMTTRPKPPMPPPHIPAPCIHKNQPQQQPQQH